MNKYIKDCCRNKDNLIPVKNERKIIIAYQCKVCRLKQAVNYLSYKGDPDET